MSETRPRAPTGGAGEGPSDHQLMARLRAGDGSALDELAVRYAPSAIRLALRMLGDRETAEDIAQEAFVRVLTAARGYRPTAPFRTWFLGIVTNLCRNEARRRARRPELAVDRVADMADTLGDTRATPEGAHAAKQLRGAVALALLSLPEKQRVALLLSRDEGLGYDEIGRVLGCSKGAVDGLLSRAKATLRERLREYLES